MRLLQFSYHFLFVTAAVFASLLFGSEGTLIAQSRRSWKAPADAKQLKNPLADSAMSVEKGGKLFRQYCADCHGVKGDGKGPMADSLKRKPANLTSSQTQALAPGEIFWRVSKGDDIMPSFEKTFPLTETERWELVQFVKSLGKKK